MAVSNRRTVLVVEDEAPLRALVADILRDEGYLVEEARDGAQALDALAHQQEGALCAVVLDMMLPGMHGMQVLKEISTQTAESTTATSQSISKLAQLSAAMRQSASGFRLPGAPVPRQVAAAGAAIAAAAAATTGISPQPSTGSTQRSRTISLAS